MRILVVEDDLTLADGLTRSLTQAGYAVDVATDGELANAMLDSTNYDLAILDLGLPKMDGLAVLKLHRKRGNKTPILILTARDTIDSRVQGLDLGADDYLTKPFHLTELEARVRALVRRGQLGTNATLACGELNLDTAAKTVSYQGNHIILSARELSLLEILMLRQNKVVNKEKILESLCNWDADIGDNAIEVYIHRLRKKIEPCGVKIKTIRGLGYLLEHA